MGSAGKILVTGGAGYIGSHTVTALDREGYDIVIADNFSNSHPSVAGRLHQLCRKSPVIHEIDLTQSEALQKLFRDEPGLSAVIHFAAFKSVSESVADPLKYYRNNLASTLNLLECMVNSNVPHLVFSSSCTVYGEPDVVPVSETALIKPAASPYGATKQISERMITDTARSSGLRSVLLRYFNPVGAHPSGLIGEQPGGVPDNLVPYITQTAIGLRDEITVFGKDYNTNDGSCIRDFIDVNDLAEAHVAALKRLLEGSQEIAVDVFNIGTGKGVSVLELIKTFEEANDIKLPYKFGPRRPGDVEAIWADNHRSRKILGWEPRTDLTDTLRSAWKWEQNCRNNYAKS